MSVRTRKRFSLRTKRACLQGPEKGTMALASIGVEGSTIGTIMPEAADYISFEFLLLIAFGIAFELPLVVFYLSFFRIVSYAGFRSAWRYVYVVLLVISAVVTPDPSPVTMMILFAVMIVMYEGSLAAARFAIVRKYGKEGLTAKSRFSILSDDEDEE